jgi:uncharacterized protein YprB with RNaseH-like and TPR domain
LDIESTGLDAEIGHMLVVGAGWFSEKKYKPFTFRIDDYPLYKKDRLDDSILVSQAYDLLEQADMIVTWYGKGFDIPFIRTRGVYWREPRSMAEPPHVDLYYTATYRHQKATYKSGSNRLDAWARWLETTNDKTRFGQKQWKRAMADYKDGIDYIDDHCKKDILVLGEVYRELRHEVSPHPNLPLILGEPANQLCPVCCSPRTFRDGFKFTRVSRHFQWRCSDCNSKSYSLPGRKVSQLR